MTSGWLWFGFNAFVVLMLALDLGVFHRKAHEVSFKEAMIWTLVWVACALGFNLWIWQNPAFFFPVEMLQRSPSPPACCRPVRRSRTSATSGRSNF